MKTINKIVHTILNVIIIFIIFILILVMYNYVQLKIFNKDYCNFFGYTILEISTNSMANTLNQYDIVIIKLTKDVTEDDIITYKDNELITHRIIKIDGEEITTKGDANNANDKTITKNEVIGKVISICSKGGIWIKVFSDPKVLISIFITVILISKAISCEKSPMKGKKED